MVTGFDHVHFYCGDMEKAIRYFEKVFDGRVTSKAEFKGYIYVRMQVSGFTIALRGVDPRNEEQVAGKEKRGLDHFGFKVDHLEKTLNELAGKGARIIVKPNISPLGLNCAFIEGPEESVVELIEEK